ALLLLFAPVVALPWLEAPADGLCVLADEGFDPGYGELPELGQFAARGAPLVGVVTERPRPKRASVAVKRPRLPRVRSLTPAIAMSVLLVASLSAGGYVLGR